MGDPPKTLPFQYIYTKVFIDREVDDYVELLLGKHVDSLRDAEILLNILPVKKRGLYEDDRHYLVFGYKKPALEDYIYRPLISAARGAVLVEHKGEYVQPAMPFAKFFNYRELSENFIRKTLRKKSSLDKNKILSTTRPPRTTSFTATEKLDGTLIIVWVDPFTGEIRANTRGVLWKDNPYVEIFFERMKALGYMYELEQLVREDRTLMFELVDHECPASMCHDEPTPRYRSHPDKWVPYLLAYRDHRTGEIVYSIKTSLPRPGMFTEDFQSLVRYVDEQRNKEGIVIHYPGIYYYPELPWWNYMLKVKNLAYVMRATSVMGGLNIRKIMIAIHKDFIDDIIPHLEGEQLDFALRAKTLYARLQEIAGRIGELYITASPEARRKIWSYARNNNRAVKPVIEGRLDKLLMMIVKPDKPDKTLYAFERLLARLEKAVPEIEAIVERYRENEELVDA